MVTAEKQADNESIVSFDTLSTVGNINDILDDYNDVQIDDFFETSSLCSISDFIVDEIDDMELFECDVERDNAMKHTMDEDIDDVIIDTLID